MDTLKKFFPLSFKYSNSSANLVIGIIIYIVIGILSSIAAGIISAILLFIPSLFSVSIIVIGLMGIAMSLLWLYILAGIVIEVLQFCKVLSD